MDPQTQDRFIEAWGTMGVLWGINRSMARVHALLIVSAIPLSLEVIASRLRISRGNASMSLKELRAWGVVRRVRQPEDRRDFYVTEPEVWTTLFRILRERKRRELDPARDAVQGVLETLEAGAGGEVAGRLAEMGELLETMNRVMERVLADPAASRAMLAFVAAGLPAAGPDPD